MSAHQSLKKIFEDLPPVGGSCAESDPDAWFPEKGDSPRLAKLICLSCPIRSECLEWAMRTDDRFGVWGGMTAQERRKLRKK